jgi:glycyl-tRNA synthetase alpha subunit
MIGDLTIAFAETIGTMWDSEEPIYSENIDMRAVMYFQHQIMVQPMPEERPEVYDNGGEF